jgi:hypothetical protein
MKAFEVYLNGRHLLTAGIGEDGVLTTIVNWVGGTPPRPVSRFDFSVGGLDSTTGEHVRWSVPSVGVGDEVTVKVVDADQVSPVESRRRPDLSDFGAELERLRKEWGRTSEPPNP